MIDVDEAQRIVLAHARPLPTEDVPLRDALYRTLAADVRCDVDNPPFDRSIMDGYAVRAADTGRIANPAECAKASATLRVAGRIAAGQQPRRPLQPGEAIRINTGAPIPPGADAVVRVEDTESANDGRDVLIRTAVEPGNFITPRAAYVKAGDVVLQTGMLLTPAEIGVAAGAGAAKLTVYRTPTVSILATGDELVDVDQKPAGAQIRNSNQYQLEALVRSAHATPAVLGVARDNRVELRRKVDEALLCDVCCITGGVSMGEFDFVPEVLAECGVTIHFQKMAIKPGRPVIFGTTPRGGLVFALPGNPVSSFIGFELLVRPALAALQGRPNELPMFMPASLVGSLPPPGKRRAFMPARARIGHDGGWTVQPLRWHGSGDTFGLAGANVMIMRPPGAPPTREGDSVSVLWIGGFAG